MTDAVRAQTAAELDRLQEGLSQEWLRLTQPSRGARPGMLSWARHILHRPGKHPGTEGEVSRDGSTCIHRCRDLAAALVLLAVGLYLALAAALVPAVALAGGAALAIFLLWTYLRAAQQVLAPRPAPTDDPRIKLPPGGHAEPAYQSYYAGQVITDMRSVITEAWAAARHAVQSPTVRGVRRWLLTGRPQPGLPVSRLEAPQLLFTAPAGIGLGAATVIGILAAILAAAIIQLVHALFLAIITVSLAAAGLVLRTAERGPPRSTKDPHEMPASRVLRANYASLLSVLQRAA